MTHAADAPDPHCDVLVVGGGPAGAATAIVLAGTGHRVVVVERQRVPRNKTCGDALSSRALAELDGLGLLDAVSGIGHRVDRVRIVARDRQLERPWPSHPDLPDHALVVRRDRLDELLVQRATSAGAELRDGHDAIAPILERGFVRGAVVAGPDGGTAEIRSRYTVVADGANSRFGRSLGTYRERSWPYATAIRGYWASPDHDAPVLEAALDLDGVDGRPLTGYGWVFPEGDGTVNVGVGVISTSHQFRTVNTTNLLRSFAARVAPRWGLDPDAPLAPAVSGRIPLGGSVGPTAGPLHLVVGDAAGLANPLTGAGIEYALLSGALAGSVLADALGDAGPTALQRYPRQLDEAVARYFKVGRLLDRFAGRPTVMDRFARAVVRSERTADAAIRIGTGSLRSRHAGGAEVVYGALRTISRTAPAS